MKSNLSQNKQHNSHTGMEEISWICQICTLENDINHHRCNVCQCHKPFVEKSVVNINEKKRKVVFKSKDDKRKLAKVSPLKSPPKSPPKPPANSPMKSLISDQTSSEKREITDVRSDMINKEEYNFLCEKLKFYQESTY